MFDFLRKPGMRHPSAAIRRALETDGLPPGTDIAELGVVTSRGSYAGRKVTFFRVFNPSSAAARAVDVFTAFTYDALNDHLDLVLRAGFVEQNGTAVVYAQPHPRGVGAPQRQQADRVAHADDERFVFPDTDAARAQARS